MSFITNLERTREFNADLHLPTHDTINPESIRGRFDHSLDPISRRIMEGPVSPQVALAVFKQHIEGIRARRRILRRRRIAHRRHLRRIGQR